MTRPTELTVTQTTTFPPADRDGPRRPVAVIGTGTMGTAIARRLLSTGMEVGVWSRRPTSTRDLVDAGATAYDRAADAVAGADVVISILATGDATTEMMLEAPTLEAMRPGSVWVQMATIGVDATDALAARTRARRPDVTFVDAPVSGSRQPAESGELLILASGPDSATGALQPIFAALGRETLWLGPAGAGSRMKLVLNTWLAFQTEGAAEAASLADRLQVPAGALLNALDHNPLASPYALAKLGRMIDHDYHPDFALEWALKDLDLVTAATGPGPAPIAHAIAQRWRRLVGDGAGGLDVSAARRGLEPSAAQVA